MIRHPMRSVCAAFLAAVAVSGCNGDDPVTLPGSTVRLTLDEYSILPREVRVLGPRVHIVARDTGILTHNVKVFSTTETDREDKPIELGGTSTAHPGETVQTTLRLEPGVYRLACSIANHDDLGAHAKLVVAGRS
jgi:uncharacterized cupredoxin-like copper-binding protein